jgi:predicted DNA-binding transcriptional regulator AlpA
MAKNQSHSVTDSGRANLIDSEALAAELGISRRTVDSWRGRGVGPRFLRICGKSVRYRREEVDAWLNGHDLFRHTHDSPSREVE